MGRSSCDRSERSTASGENENRPRRWDVAGNVSVESCAAGLAGDFHPAGLDRLDLGQEDPQYALLEPRFDARAIDFAAELEGAPVIAVRAFAMEVTTSERGMVALADDRQAILIDG